MAEYKVQLPKIQQSSSEFQKSFIRLVKNFNDKEGNVSGMNNRKDSNAN